MKKLYILSLAALGWLTAANADAQFKKSWDFEKGLSDETIANLNADSNWADNGTDADGNVNNWQNMVKPSTSTYLTANGEVIKETEGLLIDIGSNAGNSIHLATTKMRLTRKNTKVTFPKLANGQKIKIVGRSANGTATNRGIAPSYSYMVFQAEESSPQYDGQCIFVGNQVEGSEGTYTFVWKIETDSADSVDVQFTLTPDAGIDFTLFQIDNGDAPDIVGPPSVALVYEDDLAEDIDLMANAISDYTAIDLNNFDGESLLDSLGTFDALVYTHRIAAETPNLDLLTKLINRVPVLNVNASLATALGQGTVDFAEGWDGVEPVEAYAESDLFTNDGVDFSILGIGIVEEGLPAMVGILTPTDEFAAEAVLLAEPSFYQLGNNRNNYLLLPLNDELIDGEDVNLGDNLPGALNNIFDYLRDTKRAVTAVAKPAFAPEYKDGLTTVTITTSTAGAKLYYTTDGTEPTTESALYAEPLQFTEPATINVLAVARGYDDLTTSYDVIIKQQAAQPVIALTQTDGSTVVTLSAAEGDVYFNFRGASTATAALSQLYVTDATVITLTEPATIYAFTVVDGKLDSELASQYITVNNWSLRDDTLAHFHPARAEWDQLGTGKAQSLWDLSSAWEGELYTADYTEGWLVKSEGQVIGWEPDGIANGVGNGAANRYAEEATDEIGATFESGFLSFNTQSTDSLHPFSARIETASKLQAPFDVVVFGGNGGGDDKTYDVQIQVSADGIEWETIGQVNYSLINRYYKRTRVSYEGTDEVYVRVASFGGATKGRILDITVYANLDNQDNHEASLAAIEAAGEVKAVRMFNMAGQRVERAEGITLVQTIYADGTTVTKRILVK